MQQEPQKRSRTGLILLGITGTSLFGIYAVVVPFVVPAFRKHCLPFVPATPRQLLTVMRHLKRPKRSPNSSSVVDLGSGDGRLVIAAARRGFDAVGFELNPWLVWYSRLVAWRLGVSKLARFYRQDLFRAPLTRFDNVVIFGVDGIMGDIEEMVVREARPGTRVLACRFGLPTLVCDAKHGRGVDSVWIYDIRASAKE